MPELSRLTEGPFPSRKKEGVNLLREQSRQYDRKVVCPLADGKEILASHARKYRHYSGGDTRNPGVIIGREAAVVTCRNHCRHACCIPIEH